MRIVTGITGLIIGLGVCSVGVSQTLSNQSLSGKYYFRQVSLGMDANTPPNLTDPRSLLGTITFDGAGKYIFTAQQVVGGAAAVTSLGSGVYSVDPGGFVSLDNPIRGSKINARFGSEAVLGSTTESADNIFDVFVAIPAPASGATFAGPYTTVSLEFPGGSTANMRVSQFNLASASTTALQTITVKGHAANLGGAVQSQQVIGGTYSLVGDGSGALNLGTASNAQLLSGTRTIYVSKSGNLVLGGSTAAGSHDLLLGVKALTGANAAAWNNTFWGAGLRVDATGAIGYAGSMAARGTGKLTWTKRLKTPGAARYDFTGINSYSLAADGTGTAELTTVGLGAAGVAFVGAAINDADPGAYELYFGVELPQLSGTGVFVNPLGVVNAASFAPPGNPISPGQFVSLYGSGLAASNRTATPPYPTTGLNGVTVQVNGKAAPIYFVSPGQINFLVPFATTGSTATIQVTNNGANSNTVTVPLAATSPGIYALDQSGSGSGAILHADYSVVNAGNPAAPGETVLIYVTGMGMVNPTPADGTAGTVTTLYKSTNTITVLAAGKEGTVSFNGLAPGFPGLYQLNVTLPTAIFTSGPVPLAIQTGNAYHDQVDIVLR